MEASVRGKAVLLSCWFLNLVVSITWVSFFFPKSQTFVFDFLFSLIFFLFFFTKDADSVAHSVYTPGSQAVRDIVAAFGSGILQTNGEEIDRKKLGSIVFADRSEMEVSSFHTLC